MLIKKIFNGLQGIWKIRRKLQHKNADHAYAEAIGTAVFEKTDNNILFYREDGFLTTSTGQKLEFYREHFYEYSEKDDTIVKFFSEDQKKLTLMYNLKFKTTEKKEIVAIGEHLCINDTYKAEFRFPNDEFNSFSLVYLVKGPEKDYVSDTFYERETLKAAGPRSFV